MASSVAQYGLLWKEGDSGDLDPTWTATPDVSIIQKLAADHRYLMRVALPVDPFFKTEGEVATMACGILFRANPGPFRSSYELMLAKTDMQIERIKHLSPNPTDDYYCDTDEHLAKDLPDVLDQGPPGSLQRCLIHSKSKRLN
ncbi:hypothetical protein BDW59DRAFT_167727 [Aspergillus cavernicola]|uniref:Uncharacterized protein n=1 Tax=Aspergillus cavernicola TaxID=176166 RepID=A0ABR4HBD0_9EURO